MASYADGSPAPNDGRYHIDPGNPMVKVRYLAPWYPPGVTEFLSAGNTARLGLMSDGTVLKYVRDREDPHARNSLNVEHQILSAMGPHDRIVQYLGKTEHGLHLQKAKNGDIYRYISEHEHGSLPLTLRRRWIKEAAEALLFIHSKGVIHCDVHPSNFLLDERLGLRLCDFSGSLFGDLDGGAMESTRFFLPRNWQSPPNKKSDLFALGSTMYYIMTSHMPYGDLPDDEVTAKYATKEFPDVKAVVCGRVIESCWLGDFEGAGDVIQSLLEDNSV